MSAQFAIGLAGYVVGVNMLAYGARVLDKTRAENNARRISEATLLKLAMIGGGIGTVVAQQTIRHKTRKEPFRSRLAGSVLLQVLALTALVVGLAVAGSPEALWLLLTS